jgi:hypothetical protein
MCASSSWRFFPRSFPRYPFTEMTGTLHIQRLSVPDHIRRALLPMFSKSKAFPGRTKDGRLTAGLWKRFYDYDLVLLTNGFLFGLFFLR